jgi:type III secretory pathway component EscT
MPMTQEEMEARIVTLDERVAALEQLHEAQRKVWSQCAKFAIVATIPLALLLMASAVLGIITHRTDPITQVFGATMMITLFAGLTFQRAAAAMQRP